MRHFFFFTAVNFVSLDAEADVDIQLVFCPVVDFRAAHVSGRPYLFFDPGKEVTLFRPLLIKLVPASVGNPYQQKHSAVFQVADHLWWIRE